MMKLKTRTVQKPVEVPDTHVFIEDDRWIWVVPEYCAEMALRGSLNATEVATLIIRKENGKVVKSRYWNITV